MLASMTEILGARCRATAGACQIMRLAGLIGHLDASEPPGCPAPCPHLPWVHAGLQSGNARLQGEGSRETRESTRRFGMSGRHQSVVPCTRPCRSRRLLEGRVEIRDMDLEQGPARWPPRQRSNLHKQGCTCERCGRGCRTDLCAIASTMGMMKDRTWFHELL